MHMGYNVVGVCDLRKERIREFNSLFPDVFSTTKFSELASLKADVAVAATLADNKLDVIKELAQIDICRMLCEKPIVNTMSDLYDLYDFVDKEKLNVKVNHPKLWAPDHANVKKLLISKMLGNVKRVEIYFKPSGFGNIGCHLLALILFLLESKVKSAEEAYFDSRTPSIVRAKGHHDLNGKALLLLEDNIELSITNLARKQNIRPRVVLYLDNGTIDIRIAGNTYHVFDKKHYKKNQYRTIQQTP